MAKLTVRYDGSTIVNKADLSGDSAAIGYNGQTIATCSAGQTKTLPCTNKFMQSNLTVGNKTLQCANKMMTGDVAVIVEGSAPPVGDYTYLEYIEPNYSENPGFIPLKIEEILDTIYYEIGEVELFNLSYIFDIRIDKYEKYEEDQIFLLSSSPYLFRTSLQTANSLPYTIEKPYDSEEDDYYLGYSDYSPPIPLGERLSLHISTLLNGPSQYGQIVTPFAFNSHYMDGDYFEPYPLLPNSGQLPAFYPPFPLPDDFVCLFSRFEGYTEEYSYDGLKLYGFRFGYYYDNIEGPYQIEPFEFDILLYDMKPARRNSDGVIGLYDEVTGQFFGGQGAFGPDEGNPFIPGPEL